MTSPLYSAGEPVIAFFPGSAVPVVTAVFAVLGFKDANAVVYDVDGDTRMASAIPGYWYELECRPLGDRAVCHECCLRPLRDPDTEYLTDSAPQKLETTL